MSIFSNLLKILIILWPAYCSLQYEIKDNEIIQEDDSAPYIFYVTGGYITTDDLKPLQRSIVSVRLGRPRKFFGDNHKCGGSIIAEKEILTAAHCLMASEIKVYSALEVSVLAGSDSRFGKSQYSRVYHAKEVKIHPKFDKKAPSADIALIILTEKITEDGVNVKRIPITNNPIQPDQNTIVYGWGAVHFNGPSAEHLVYTNVTTLSRKTCSKYEPNLEPGIFCAGDLADPEADTCQGDSGGPLVGPNGTLLGVVSFGHGCGRSSSPGFYTDVYFYRKWILANAANIYEFNVNCFVFTFFICLYK